MRGRRAAVVLVGAALLAAVAGAAPHPRPAVGVEVEISTAAVALTQDVLGGPAMEVVTVSNAGTLPLAISAITHTGDADWSFVAGAPCMTGTCTLPVGASFTVTVVFDPSAIGTHDAAIQITSNAPTSPATVTLTGLGQGATLALASDLGASPTLELGPVPIGVTVQRSLQLRNDGNVDLDGVALALTPAAGALALLTPSPTTITASGTRDVEVTCTPTSAGPITGTLAITAPTAISGSPLTIDITCTGTTGALYAVPSLVELDEIRLGSAPRTVMVELRTTGTALTITEDPALATSPPGLAVTAPDVRAIGPSTPARFALEVTPGEEADLATTISVTATGSSGTETLEVPVTGRVVVARVDAPIEIAAGSFCVGQATTAVEAALTATGSGRVGLPTQPVLARMATSPFQLTYTSPVAYPYQLPSGARATLQVTPLRQMTAGEQADDLVWTTDVEGQESVTTQVVARFLEDGGAITPQLIDFGGITVGGTAPTRLVRIQNCGTEPIMLVPPVFAPGGEFVDVSTTPLPASLAPLQLATLEIGFSPRQRGPRIAALTVASSKGPLIVQLRGDGLDDPARKRDTTSFYACSATGPANGVPLGLALVVLCGRHRRRRRVRCPSGARA